MKRFLALSLVLSVLFFIFGCIFTSLVPGVSDFVFQSKREVRSFLGLPKFWLPIADKSNDRGRPKVDCPTPDEAIVIITGGQSNASNAVTGEQELAAQSDDVYTFFNNACYKTQDPVLGTDGSKTSLWPQLGKKLSKETSKPVLFLHTAISGTQASDWLDNRSGYMAAYKAQANQLIEAGYKIHWVIWHQGETDAAVQKNYQSAYEDFNELTDKLLEGLEGTRMYLFQVSRCVGKGRQNGVSFIIDAQKSVAESDPRIVLGMNTDELGLDYRWDMCHFNSSGKEKIVAHVVNDLVGKRLTKNL